MFGFLKKCFLTAMTIFGCSVLSVNSLECVSMNNQECKKRETIMKLHFILTVLK